MHTKIKISKISFNLSGAKSVLVIPRQVTMHTSQNQLGLDQGPVTVYSTLTSRSRHPWPSSESLDFNVVGVDHLPRLASAQNELVLRLANHGLVLLGHLFYGLAELHKLCPDRLRSSTRRSSDGLSEPLQAGCIGGHVHRKISSKYFEPGLSVEHNCDPSVIMAEVSIGVSLVIPMALLVLQSFCTAAQLLQEIDQRLSLLVQGLVKARSDAVDVLLHAKAPGSHGLQSYEMRSSFSPLSTR